MQATVLEPYTKKITVFLVQADAGSVNSKPNAKAGTSKTKAVVLGLLLSTSKTKAVVLGLLFSTSTNIGFRFASLLGFLFLPIPKLL